MGELIVPVLGERQGAGDDPTVGLTVAEALALGELEADGLGVADGVAEGEALALA